MVRLNPGIILSWLTSAFRCKLVATLSSLGLCNERAGVDLYVMKGLPLQLVCRTLGWFSQRLHQWLCSFQLRQHRYPPNWKWVIVYISDVCWARGTEEYWGLLPKFLVEFLMRCRFLSPRKVINDAHSQDSLCQSHICYPWGLLLPINRASIEGNLNRRDTWPSTCEMSDIKFHFEFTWGEPYTISISTSLKAIVTKSLTLVASPVEITKSSGFSCCSIIHMAYNMCDQTWYEPVGMYYNGRQSEPAGTHVVILRQFLHQSQWAYVERATCVQQYRRLTIFIELILV